MIRKEFILSYKKIVNMINRVTHDNHPIDMDTRSLISKRYKTITKARNKLRKRFMIILQLQVMKQTVQFPDYPRIVH